MCLLLAKISSTCSVAGRMGSSSVLLEELRSSVSIEIVDAVLLSVESIAADSERYAIQFNEGLRF